MYSILALAASGKFTWTSVALGVRTHSSRGEACSSGQRELGRRELPPPWGLAAAAPVGDLSSAGPGWGWRVRVGDSPWTAASGNELYCTLLHFYQ